MSDEDSSSCSSCSGDSEREEMPSLLGRLPDGESSDSECSGEGALEEESCESSSQDSDEDKSGVIPKQGWPRT